MKISKKIADTPAVVLIILLVIGVYLVYHIVMFLAKVFIYVGFNMFLFTDNLLHFESANPFVLWGFMGILLGSIFGVIIATKKYRLSKKLILYPFSLLIIILTVLFFINKPTQSSMGTYNPPVKQDIYNQTQFVNYTTTQAVNVRTGASPNTRKLISLSKGSSVQFIEFVDGYNNVKWAKIKYNGQTGYINSKYLEYSPTAN